MILIYHGEEKIFVNQSFCPYHRILFSKTKRLQSTRKINSFFISGGTVKIKSDENSKKPLTITHLDYLAINFPGVDQSPSPNTLQWRTGGCCVQLLYYILQFLVYFLLSLWFLQVLPESICPLEKVTPFSISYNFSRNPFLLALCL